MIALIPNSTNVLHSRWTDLDETADQKKEKSFFVKLPGKSIRHLHQNKIRSYNQTVSTIGLVYETNKQFGRHSACPRREKN